MDSGRSDSLYCNKNLIDSSLLVRADCKLEAFHAHVFLVRFEFWEATFLWVFWIVLIKYLDSVDRFTFVLKKSVWKGPCCVSFPVSPICSYPCNPNLFSVKPHSESSNYIEVQMINVDMFVLNVWRFLTRCILSTCGISQYYVYFFTCLIYTFSFVLVFFVWMTQLQDLFL